MVNFRMDARLKHNMEATCKKMGLTLGGAFTMFATKVIQEQRIPFDVVADPFFNENNILYLKKKLEEFRNGTLKFVEHDLIDPYSSEHL